MLCCVVNADDDSCSNNNQSRRWKECKDVVILGGSSFVCVRFPSYVFFFFCYSDHYYTREVELVAFFSSLSVYFWPLCKVTKTYHSAEGI